ncbi:sodium-coupled monocarboxylate transporter 1 isoform X2 [Phlebotomus papatasi]|uniref:sodium-coupled monocarboxylate transporter 1 isoform X2 n=1 Tax=Phlebotomus papatasi TaxID=29031 RepID=UPI0024837AD6|nr:sodium-coupled monocarboxylate transporter 1 isoform X2 [Phlebotomus papatasi]XP_055713752.1 sodium-coupled monocarboxylate transporter 1 isoform X2 [Phlebotomus papatasi]XP_055713753.1 sodium-coupled monocarboxylate transporter 1 isoform X2 [Phlebotomus papatasi]XP_055713754.1 sodium-coupled monocarboxylate transporter 1 isoform X2 [Phlebotomus papatasi]
MNEDPPQSEYFHFHIVDYCVFAAMLILSAVSGTYFGYFRRKTPVQIIPPSQGSNKKTGTDFGSLSMSEYLLGSRKLKSFPVAMSLVASYISGVTILGTPSEIYNYGIQYWLMVVPILLMGIAVSFVYLPVFMSLKVGSSYEYLELRFSSAVRSMASFMFVLDEIFFLPIIVYVPALAFNQVTGVDLHLIAGIVCIVCVFYTTIGGIKAVVHTDAWQIVVMFISVFVVATLGTIALGGPAEVFRRATEGNRIDLFNFNPSFYERHTFWGVLIGGFMYWTSFNSVNQTMVQRYMSLPNLKTARISIAMYTVGISLFVSACCYAGVLIYAYYYKCDPSAAGLIQADDQLFPNYVMETVGDLKGVPGLFIAGVFGAALSSLSVVLNSTSAVLLEDILKGCFKVQPNERWAAIFVKSSIILLGCVAMALIFVVERLGGILSVATSLTAIAAATTFGVFTLGMLVPWSNTKGAIAGVLAGALMSGWVSLGSQAAVANGYVVPHKLDISTENCPAFNSTAPDYPDESDVFPLYRFSFHWINPIGIISVLIVGSIVSLLTGPRDLKQIDPELISPVIHRFLPSECFIHYGTTSMERNQLNEDASQEDERLEFHDRVSYLASSPPVSSKPTTSQSNWGQTR